MSSNKRTQSYSNKNKYWNQSKKRKCLESGTAGFLCTCDGKFKEKECVRDSYNLLNDFADEIFGKEEWRQAANETEDVDASLEDELTALKAQNEAPKSERRFQVVESGANGVIFIKTTVPDPGKLAHAIVSDIAKTKVQKSKVVMRITPVEITCKANMDDICKAADSLLPKYFQDGGKKFSIIFNHRNNDSLSRDKLIDVLANKVTALNDSNSVSLKSPDLSVAVEVIRSICCLAVIPEYFALKKYNILELAQNEIEKINVEPTPVVIEETPLKENDGIEKEKSVEEEKNAEDDKTKGSVEELKKVEEKIDNNDQN